METQKNTWSLSMDLDMCSGRRAENIKMVVNFASGSLTHIGIHRGHCDSNHGF